MYILQTCTKCAMRRETFHLALDYFDRYYKADVWTDGDTPDIKAVAALVIAAKVEVSVDYDTRC